MRGRIGIEEAPGQWPCRHYRVHLFALLAGYSQCSELVQILGWHRASSVFIAFSQEDPEEGTLGLTPGVASSIGYCPVTHGFQSKLHFGSNRDSIKVQVLHPWQTASDYKPFAQA